MHTDPSGHGILAIFVVSIILGAAVSVAEDYVPDVVEKIEENGFQWNDFVEPLEENWKEYLVLAMDGAVVGGSFATGVALGFNLIAAPGFHSIATTILGLHSIDVGSRIAGTGIYLLETEVLKINEYDNNEKNQAGLQIRRKCLSNFYAGALIGVAGLYPNNANNKLKLVLVRSIIKYTISEIFKEIEE